MIVENKLDTNSVSGNYHFKIRLMNYDELMKISEYLRSIDGYSFITTGSLVVEGTALQLENMINFIDNSFAFSTFEFVDMYESYLGESNDIKEMLKEDIRNEKLDNLGI